MTYSKKRALLSSESIFTFAWVWLVGSGEPSEGVCRRNYLAPITVIVIVIRIYCRCALMTFFVCGLDGDTNSRFRFAC